MREFARESESLRENLESINEEANVNKEIADQLGVDVGKFKL